MSTIRRQFIDTDIGQMHVRLSRPEIETARPLVCLHMSPLSGAYFQKFMETVGSDRLVIAPDYHGFGESDAPPAEPPVRIEDYARTIWQALDVLKIDKVDFLGHHTGSKVSAEMTRQNPNRVGSIVMISASTMSAEDYQASRLEEHFNPIPLDEDGTRFTSLWKGFQRLNDADLPIQITYKYVLDALRPGEAYQWGSRAAFLYNEHFADVLKDLPHPFTVINPNDDLYSITPSIMSMLQNARLIDKPNWRHGLFHLRVDEVAATVLQALKDMENSNGAMRKEA